ncbi:LuxR family two component transcriptional regulator [Labedella gwakjiensis]|uniref:LuxR family two component transcriptional regulator n=1 Tax=Labedella gwakjiensis TaxID=390269 RepID=A0A2P8GWR0_9MICO|nr:response regulator transcription factor [Labedella gwakjiensis]PSL38398.1 LuxR family two component transcriptional regulator [Labedella gwakjiensis]RUQ87075.1 response regulator transcription factor [Labedella gwakjiensis]
MTKELRVIVVDDSVLLREGLVRLIEEAGHRVVGSAGSGEELHELLTHTEADIVLLDVRMPPTFRDEGVTAALRVRTEHPSVGILLLSQYVEVAYARELLGSGRGGVGYLLKDRVSSLAELEDAIERISEGGTVLDPEVVSQLLGRRRDPLEALTARERDVLELMAEGRTNVAIASALFVGTGAVEKHVTSIFQKLGLEDSGSDHRRVLAVVAYLHR